MSIYNTQMYNTDLFAKYIYYVYYIITIIYNIMSIYYGTYVYEILLARSYIIQFIT